MEDVGYLVAQMRDCTWTASRKRMVGGCRGGIEVRIWTRGRKWILKRILNLQNQEKGYRKVKPMRAILFINAGQSKTNEETYGNISWVLSDAGKRLPAFFYSCARSLGV